MGAMAGKGAAGAGKGAEASAASQAPAGAEIAGYLNAGAEGAGLAESGAGNALVNELASGPGGAAEFWSNFGNDMGKMGMEKLKGKLAGNKKNKKYGADMGSVPQAQAPYVQSPYDPALVQSIQQGVSGGGTAARDPFQYVNPATLQVLLKILGS